MKRIMVGLAVSLPLTLASAGPVWATAANPKAGQFCAAKDKGKTVKGVTCRKDGDRYRWRN